MIKFMDEWPGVMVDDFIEWLQANTTLANVSVEKSDANHNIGKFTELGDFLRSC